MRVLFLSNEVGLERSQSAYSHRLERLAESLEEAGAQTSFLSLREQRYGRPVLAQPLNRRAVLRGIRDVDVVHAGGNAAYTAALLRRSTDALIVFDVHGDAVAEARLKREGGRNWRSSFQVVQARVADGIAFRRAHRFLAVSEPLRDRLVHEHGIPRDLIGVIRNGVDPERVTSSPVERAGVFKVAYAGSFQRWQGIDNLIDAAARLPQEAGVELHVIGFGPEDEPLRGEIASRLADRAELVDRLPRTELTAYLAQMHALVIPRTPHPAVDVAFPSKFSEYLALGKPVIVCDVDETARFVRDHDCGIVADPSPAGLSEAILDASRLPADRLAEMGANGRRLAEEDLSWKAIGDRYHRLLESWTRGTTG